MNRIPRSSLARACAVVLLLLAGPALATPGNGNGNGSGGGSSNSNRGQHRGRLVTVLPDGTLREPSADRAQATVGTDVLDAGDWSWDVGGGGAASWIGGTTARGVEGPATSVDHGFGHGFQLGVASDGWQGSRVEQGSPPAPVTETGLGGMRIGCEQRLFGGDSTRALALAASVRLPGGLDSPAAHTTEASLALPVSVPLGPHAHVGAMIAGEWAGDALDDGHHMNGIASAELVRALHGEWSGWLETVSVWSGETGRRWLGVLDGGIEGDLVPHVAVRLGMSGGLGGGRGDVGVLGGVSVHG